LLTGSAASAISGQDPGTLLPPATGLALLAAYACVAAAIDRAEGFHVRTCPVARSIGGSVDITTELVLVPNA
jgi:hypothetical protein